MTVYKGLTARSNIYYGTSSITNLYVGLEGSGPGPVIWTPAALFPSLWYDASDADTIMATGGAVDTWKNKGSIAGADATAATTARPVTGTRASNGLNCLDFDGTNSIMTIVGDALNISNGLSTLVVICESDTAGQQVPLGGTTTGVRWGIVLNAGGTAGRITAVSNTASVLQDISGKDLTGLNTYIQRVAPTQNVQISINEDRFGNTAAARADVVLTALRIGGVATGAITRFDGKMCEILAFNRALSVDEMAKIVGYARAKWGAKTTAGLLDEWSTDDPRTVSHKQNVIAWGDSLTFGTGSTDPTTKSWPAVLAAARGCKVERRGVPGAQSTVIRANMLADDDYRDRITMLFAGRNDYGTPSQVIGSIALMYAYPVSGKVVVMTVLNGNVSGSEVGGTEYNNIKTVNDNSKATYPNNVLDIRQLLVNAGAPGGAYPDATRYALDEWPNSLRTDPSNDPIHLNDNGYAFIAAQVKAFIDAKGW